MESTNFLVRDAERPKKFSDRKQREAQELEALKAKLISVLEISEDKDKLRTSRKNAAGKSVTVIHIGSPLFSTLRTCLQHLNYLSCAHILKYLVENIQCNMDSILHLITKILEKDSSQTLPLSNFLSSFNNMHNTSRDEVCLLQLIYHLNCGQFKEALSVVSKANDLQWSRFKCNTLAPEVAFNLLSGYKTVLQYVESNSSDLCSEGHYLESFQALTTENCFLPIFAETYTQLLLKSSEPDQAEEFIRKFVECESKNSGLIAPLQALSIVKLHMSKNQKLICDLLQAVAEKDSSHPLVLELCWKHLRNNVKMKDHASSDSDIDSGENSDDVSRSRPENLNKCLSLIFTFLDSDFNNCQAWSILSENLRSICLLGSKECAAALVSLWHQSGRRNWWLDECFCLRSEPPPAPIDLLINKAISCFILEDASHSFVQHVLSVSNTAQLTIIMNQLEKAKRRLDILIKTILNPVSCASNVPTASDQSISKREAEIRILFLEFIKSSRVKTELDAEICSILASSNSVRKIHVPIKKYDENFYWDLPVYQRFKNRLEKRDEERKAKRGQNVKKNKKQKRTKISKAHISSSENDSEDEIIDQLIRGHQEKRERVDTKRERVDTEAVFARPTTPVDSDSPLPPASFPCPTPDLQFTSTPAPKETICIEERYRFFDCDSLSSDTDITDMNVATETEPLLPVQKSAEDERSEEKSNKESAQMSSVCTSTTFRFEASSPDIFRPECDRLSEAELHQQSPSVSKDHQPNPEECCKTSKSVTSKKVKKRNEKRRTTKSPQKSLSDICRQVVDSAIHEQAASETISEQRDDVSSSNAHSTPQSGHEDREALIAELLGNGRRTVSHSSQNQKGKMKKQEKSGKTKTKKNMSREDIIAELLKISTQSFKIEPEEPAPSKRQSRQTPVSKKQKPVVTRKNAADEREVIIGELLNSHRQSLDGPVNSPKVEKTNASEEDDYIPTDAEELKIQMAIERVIRKSHSTASSFKSDDHSDGNGADLHSRSRKRKISLLVDRSTNARKSNQRIEKWLEQVIIQNAEMRQEAEKSSKRARYQDRSSLKKSPKEKQPASHPAVSTPVDRVPLPPNLKAQSSNKDVCHVDVDSPVKRKKLFSKVGNFLDLTYRSKRI